MAVVDGGSQWRMIYSAGSRNRSMYDTTSNSILRRPDPDDDLVVQVLIYIRRIHRFVCIDADGVRRGNFDVPTGILSQRLVAFLVIRNPSGCLDQLCRTLSSASIPGELSPQIAGSIFRRASTMCFPEQGLSSVIQLTADLTLITAEEVFINSSDAAMACGQNQNLGGDCPICLEDLSSSTDGDSEARKLLSETPCVHVFHDSCIRRWLDTNPTCPLCRRCIIS